MQPKIRKLYNDTTAKSYLATNTKLSKLLSVTFEELQ